ncbi:hypothetical protein [Terricaulis sp.]|uniref:hypothetical protein n=1 Tax=Terricaulis sp. TaxID=2768686 RepID=UPI0037844A99
MATVSLEPRRRTSVLHSVAVGAAALGSLFILLWASEALGIGPSTRALMHQLALSAREASLQALIRGLPFALAFGAFGGAMVAIFANVFRFLDPPRTRSS